MEKIFNGKSAGWIAVVTIAILLFTVSVPPQGEAKTVEENVTEKFYYVCAPAKLPGEFSDTVENDAYRDSLASYICHVNSTISEDTADELVDSIMESSEKYGVDETLIMAIAQTESCYESDALSSAECKGIMQTGDVLAEEAGYDGSQLFDPQVSIDVGTSYIRDKLDEFDDVALALTAYNQGSGAVYSGEYDSGYADITVERIGEIENYIDDYVLQ